MEEGIKRVILGPLGGYFRGKGNLKRKFQKKQAEAAFVYCSGGEDEGNQGGGVRIGRGCRLGGGKGGKELIRQFLYLKAHIYSAITTLHSFIVIKNHLYTPQIYFKCH